MINAAHDEALIKQYLADSPPSVVPLAIKPHFEALNDQEKLYAHYISVYGVACDIHHHF
jgi:dipeptidyl-peptidase III